MKIPPCYSVRTKTRRYGQKTHIHQTEARHHVVATPLVDRRPVGREGAGGTARVDKELVHVLEALEPVRAAPAEHVDIEPVRFGQQQVGLVADEREPLEKADADAAVRHDLRERQRRRLDVHTALYDLEVGRHRPQVLVRRLVRQVAEAERLADLTRREELLELGTPGAKKAG